MVMLLILSAACARESDNDKAQRFADTLAAVDRAEARDYEEIVSFYCRQIDRLLDDLKPHCDAYSRAASSGNDQQIADAETALKAAVAQSAAENPGVLNLGTALQRHLLQMPDDQRLLLTTHFQSLSQKFRTY